jgi:hypothetical protein
LAGKISRKILKLKKSDRIYRDCPELDSGINSKN